MKSNEENYFYHHARGYLTSMLLRFIHHREAFYVSGTSFSRFLFTINDQNGNLTKIANPVKYWQV